MIDWSKVQEWGPVAFLAVLGVSALIGLMRKMQADNVKMQADQVAANEAAMNRLERMHNGMMAAWGESSKAMVRLAESGDKQAEAMQGLAAMVKGNTEAIRSLERRHEDIPVPVNRRKKTNP